MPIRFPGRNVGRKLKHSIPPSVDCAYLYSFQIEETSTQIYEAETTPFPSTLKDDNPPTLTPTYMAAFHRILIGIYP